MASVGANRDRGAFLHLAAVCPSATHAHNCVAIDDVLVDVETLTHVCPTRRRGIDEDLVQRFAPRPVRPRQAVLDDARA